MTHDLLVPFPVCPHGGACRRSFVTGGPIKKYLAHHSFAVRLLLILLFVLCGAVLLYHEGDYLLSSRRASVLIAPQEAPLLRSMPGFPEDESGKTDINLATAEDLQKASGIGSVTAEKILALREQRGGFYFIEELMDVSGVGEKRFDALKELFFCDPPAAP